MKASPKRALPRAGELARARAELGERLRERRGEIEEGMRARISAIADPGEVADPAYSEGLRGAVGEALRYGLQGMGASEEHPPPIPVALLAQARLAARNRVGIDTVLRRYCAGYTLLGDFLVREAAELNLPGAELKPLLNAQAAAFDRLLAAISEEHARESTNARPATSQQRRLELVRRLLRGEPVDTSQLGYELDAHHLAVVGLGTGAEALLRGLASELDRRLLLVCPDERTCWAWLGGRSPLHPAATLAEIRPMLSPGLAIAIGEPGQGPAEWRLSHRQAAAALAVAVRGPEPAVRYADVALLAAALQDELLEASLRRLYLEPLETAHDRGEASRHTVRAFLNSRCNITATAASLGIARKTVSARLRAVERLYGCPLTDCAADLQVVLGLHDIAASDADHEVSDRAISPA